MNSLHCPACGAPLTIANRFVKVVTCDFCQQVSLFKDNTLDPTGRTAKLLELPSRLFLDAVGTITGRRFQVMGRLRYAYDAGRWDEWFLWLDDREPGWLVEDEGSYKLFHKQTLHTPLPSFAQVQVGQILEVNRLAVFIVEKRVATIAGSEGQLAFQTLPGEKVAYLDGVAGEQQVSIEYTETEIEFSVGRDIASTALVVEEEF